MASWNPDQYLRFGDERTRPSVELVSRIGVERPASVVDLGCGPGNSTQVLLRKWPRAHVIGVDNSREMIAAARKAYPNQQWMLAEIETWTPETPVDVVFSNAALQWVRGHPELIRRLFGNVAGGGALAFQIPSPSYSAVRTLIDDIASEPQWEARTSAARDALTMEDPRIYYDALATLARSIDMWETEYYHVMESPSAIVEWIASTGLRPYLDELDTEAERELFVSALEARVEASYERRSDGRVLFPFRRLFFIAYV